MSAPDVLVTVEGGVAQVDVWRPGIVVELRDYDVDGEDDDDLWTDAHGDPCLRYMTSMEAAVVDPAWKEGLARFAEDLAEKLGLTAAFHPDPKPDGLHVLSINGTDFFFNADGTGYDGWGCRLSKTPPANNRP